MSDQMIDTPVKAYVVFSDKTELRWLKFLRRGFRHCFVILHDGKSWISVDPMAHYIDVRVLPYPPGYHVQQFLRDQGLTVVTCDMGEPEKICAPPAIVSCTEIVKRILGLRQPLIFTPYQLFRYLEKKGI